MADHGRRVTATIRSYDDGGQGDLNGEALAIPRIDIAGSEREPPSEAIPTMAHISEFSIITFQRKPGHWRAAISPRLLRSGAPGETVHNFVTPYDSASEAEAQFAAEQLIRKMQSR
jgi:hypothetical protein